MAFTEMIKMLCLKSVRALVIVDAVIGLNIYWILRYPMLFQIYSVECYDTSTKQWKYVASMSHPRRYVAAAALNGLLYAVGGYDGFSVLDSVEAYDPKLDQWKRVANMSNARRHVAVGVLDKKDAGADTSGPGTDLIKNSTQIMFLQGLAFGFW